MSTFRQNLRGADWITSSRSNGYGGACVEVALTADAVGVRDSKNRGGGTLVFGAAQWSSFLYGIKT